MFVGRFTYQVFTHGANENIQRRQLKELLKHKCEAETLKEVQRVFWDFFHKNKGPWHSYTFIAGNITDMRTGKTWMCDSYGRKAKGENTMSLPAYNKNNRRQTFQQLPKAAYVVRIMSAKIAKTQSGFEQLVIAFDIAEGEYKDFYKGQFDRNTSEDKKWPNDAIFRLTIPYDGCADYIVTNYDSFFADLEDSNDGFVFSGDEKTLKGKLIGAKMHIGGNMWNGKPYTHTRMRWTCVADDVRNGKAGRLPADKYSDDWNPNGTGSSSRSAADSYASSGFSSSNDDEIPFD